MKFITIILLMCSNLYALPSKEKPPEIRISAFYYPPLLIGKNPEKPGLYLDLATYIFGKSGYKVKYDFVSFMRAYQSTQTCMYDAIGAVSPSHANNLLLSRIVPVKLTFDFWVKTENKWQYKDETSLKGMRLAHIDGYDYSQASKSYQEYLLKNKNQVTLISGEETTHRIFKMILYDRIDAFNIDRPQAYWTIKEYGLEGKLRSAGSLPHTLDGHLAFCPGEKGERFRKIFDEGLKKEVHTPEIKNLFKKYNLEDDWEKLRQKLKVIPIQYFSNDSTLKD